MASAAFTMPGDILAIVYDQLPRRVSERVALDIKSDPFHFVVIAKFTTADGREWVCELDRDRDIKGHSFAHIIPEAFIARLSAEV